MTLLRELFEMRSVPNVKSTGILQTQDDADNDVFIEWEWTDGHYVVHSTSDNPTSGFDSPESPEAASWAQSEVEMSDPYAQVEDDYAAAKEDHDAAKEDRFESAQDSRPQIIESAIEASEFILMARRLGGAINQLSGEIIRMKHQGPANLNEALPDNLETSLMVAAKQLDDFTRKFN